MSTLSRYIIFVAVVVGVLWLAEHLTGQPLLDDADARTAPFRHVTP